MTINHVCMYVSDIKKAEAFYLAALQPLGYKKVKDFGKVVGFASWSGSDFWLVEDSVKDPESKKEFLRVHIAFNGSSKGQVHKFHQAALKAGATCNGPPGYRPQYREAYYGAFVLDEDGNNIECINDAPWWLIGLKSMPILLGAGALALAYRAGKKGWF